MINILMALICFVLFHSINNTSALAESARKTSQDKNMPNEAEEQVKKGFSLMQGPNKNLTLAADFFEKAAKAGNSNGQLMLGAMFRSGDGRPKDIKQAIRWFEAAADQNNANALHELGVMYFQGKLVPEDLNKSAKYLEKSSNFGNHESQGLLGRLYLDKKSNLNNSALGFMLNLQAASFGDLRALEFLSDVALNKPDAKDRQLIQGYAWLALAAKNGSDEAKGKLDLLTKTLSPSDLALAKELVSRWEPGKSYLPLDTQLNITYPPTLGEFSLSSFKFFEVPGLGYQAFYLLDGSTRVSADIYAYDRNKKEVGDGVSAPMVGKELEQNIKDIAHAQEKKILFDSKLLDGGKTNFPNLKYQYLWKSFQLRYPEDKDPSMSVTYITAVRGKLIKIRLSVAKEKYPAVKNKIDLFLKALSALLASQTK